MRPPPFATALSLALSALALCAGGCGGPPKPAASADEPKKAEGEPAKPEADKPKGKGGPQVQQDTGSLDKKAVEQAFAQIGKGVEKCQDDRRKQLEKLDFLSGALEVEVHVGQDGKVAWVGVPHSTLGDRGVEKCILEAARQAPWPKPEGGKEGYARTVFTLPMKGDRDAVAWDKAKAEASLGKAKQAIAACRSGKKSPVEITAYVDTDGKVIASGASSPEQGSDGAADCIADALRGVKFPSPGGWPAKVTFTAE